VPAARCRGARDRLTSLDAATRNPMLQRDIERLLDGGVPDPA
jgi:hypothetical protein